MFFVTYTAYEGEGHATHCQYAYKNMITIWFGLYTNVFKNVGGRSAEG